MERSVRPAWILLTVGLGTLMGALDTSIVNAVLPVIRQGLHAGMVGSEWVILAYLLTISGTLLSMGRIMDLWGGRPVYLAGFLIFGTGSLLCGLSPTILLLILARIAQAVGASMMMATGPAILSLTFPARSRGRALGLQATLTYLGLAVGPAAGGALTALFSWHAIFFVNVPIALVGLALAAAFLPAPTPRPRPAFDRRGAALWLSGLTLLLLAVSEGPGMGWGNPWILGGLTAGLLLLAAFVRLERRLAAPMMDLRLFRNPLFRMATAAAFLNYVGVYTVLYMMPFYLLSVRHLGAGTAGVLLSAMPLVMLVTAPVAGTLSDRLGARLFVSGGMLLLALGLFSESLVSMQTTTSTLVWRLMLAGLGTGLFVSPNNSDLLGAAPADRQGVAGGVLASARSTGMVSGVAIAGVVYRATDTFLRSHRSPEVLARLGAVRMAFLVAAVIALVGVVVTLIRPGNASRMAAEG